jgi:hypothetical protein
MVVLIVFSKIVYANKPIKILVLKIKEGVINNQIDFISSNINGPVYNSESKNPEVFCCKFYTCHAQGAKCTNC